MNRRRWIGRWIVAVGVVHCIVGAVLFSDSLAGILRDGIWNAVDGYPGRPLAFWFEVVGLLTILLGSLVDQIDGQGQIPGLVRYGFPVLALLGIIAMPAGGGWLLLPPAIGLILMKPKSAVQSSEPGVTQPRPK